jgi:hypothetical protein
MDIVNCEIALGGDKRNTVPKKNVTAAEVAVLRRVHGEDAVFNIEPVGQMNMSNRGELIRLRETYRGMDEDNTPLIESVYPGAAARVFETLEELDLPEDLFKPLARATAPVAPAKKGKGKKAAPVAEDDGDDLPELPADDPLE